MENSRKGRNLRSVAFFLVMLNYPTFNFGLFLRQNSAK